jgi:voltage-gated potassium channel
MTDTRDTPSRLLVEARDPNLDDPTGRLAAYIKRTQNGLDLLALVTLFLVVVPPSDFGTDHGATIALVVRVLLSVIYGIDATIRTRYAQNRRLYLRTHRVMLVSVVLPPVRVIFSIRLIRSLFRRGHLSRFLLGATVLMLNGAAIVYLVEHDAPGANIKTLGNSLWWAIVTITTVGYGDYTPVTVAGRVVGTMIMGIGILVLAVITAQVSSNFVDQAARRRRGEPEEATTPTVTLVELGERLDRIEALLTRRTTTDR